ncbi:hypothetical protein [Agaribacterium sp. ZY112]|uniref:hypothetical protein n=1 Tax=Agaribacterium sp. ZY112 TaxID=3233574 RepID=UPI003523C209
MSLISCSHVDLVRTRKSLEFAFDNKQWGALKRHDLLMGEALDKAFDDKTLNAKELMSELERVLALYARIVAELPASESEFVASFPFSR